MENTSITPEQALNNLYLAARRAPLTADEHDAVRASALVLQKAVTKEEPKKK